jgi:hypothetical protein
LRQSRLGLRRLYAGARLGELDADLRVQQFERALLCGSLRIQRRHRSARLREPRIGGDIVEPRQELLLLDLVALARE